MKTLTILPIMAVLLLTACDKKPPKCSDKETINMVVQITKDAMAKVLPVEVLDKPKVVVKNIRTVEFNKDAGSYSCKADLSISATHTADDALITYTTEVTDDGKDFYVSVYGL